MAAIAEVIKITCPMCKYQYIVSEKMIKNGYLVCLKCGYEKEARNAGN